MPKFAANLTMLWNEIDFLDRFEKAAKAGFTGVEYLFPYAYPAEQLKEKLEKNGLTQALHNLPAGDWPRASAVSPCCRTGWASSRTAWARPSTMPRCWAPRR